MKMTLPFKPHVLALICSAGLCAASTGLYIKSRTVEAPVEPQSTQLAVSDAAAVTFPATVSAPPVTPAVVKSTRSVFGPAAGFAPKELQTGNGVWRVDMMKCPYHDTCTEYGCPELCRCFCDSDDISYTGLHPKLIWERSMTLGRGNDRCDFCMKIVK